MTGSSHPRYWIAVMLLLLTGQTGLYRAYLGRAGSAAVMSGALLFAISISLAVPSQVAGLIVLGVFLGLSAVVVIDLVRMTKLVDEGHSRMAQKAGVEVLSEEKV
jgi:hypothetical protein